MPISLPTETTKPKANLAEHTIFLYGPPKIGKSTFASQFEKPLFLATEAGLNDLETYNIPIGSWADFLEACNLIKAGNHDYKTIVIDTIDNLYTFCQEHVCAKAGVQHESDLEWGKGWTLVKQEFTRAITKLSLLPYGLVMTSHAEEKEIKPKYDVPYTKTVPTLAKAAREIVLGLSDIILYAEIAQKDDKEIRVIRTKPTNAYEAGDRTGRLPETVLFKHSAFIKAWNKGTTKTNNEEEQSA